MSRLNAPLAAQLDAPGLDDWAPTLRAWAAGEPGKALLQAVDARLAAGAVVYPATPFRALALTSLARTRVVIVGQDPYHGAGQAEGLAFSVPHPPPWPPSLRNILAELQRDLGLAPPPVGTLQPWAERGVMLLNTALTVEEGRAGSHAKLGWQHLTDSVVDRLAGDPAPKAFLLWGAHAQALAPRLACRGPQHLLLQCNHPSPLSASRPPVPFVGCGHFGRAAAFVAAAGRGALDWSLA